MNETKKEWDEQAYQDRLARFDAEQAPILEEIRSAGMQISDIRDLGNTSAKYTDILPILLKHLQLPYSDAVRASLARALAVREAQFAWPILVQEYLSAPEGRGDDGIPLAAKDGLACALAGAVTAASMPELIELAMDGRNGESRLFFLIPLRRSKLDIAKKALAVLADDPQLEKEIGSWKSRSPK